MLAGALVDNGVSGAPGPGWAGALVGVNTGGLPVNGVFC
ncbi:MAG: hypothetical protein RJA70_2056 [Pseudomonadota bacterium]